MHAYQRLRTLSLIIALSAAGQAFAEEGLVFVDASQGMPTAEPLADDFRHEPLCDGEARPQVTQGERELGNRGWLLTAEPVVWGEYRFVTGSAGIGGQCRPMDNRIFLFRGDRYLGHVSSPDKQARHSIKLEPTGAVEFSTQYRKPGDPNCCPSGEGSLRVDLRSK